MIEREAKKGPGRPPRKQEDKIDGELKNELNPRKSFCSLEELEAMPLQVYEDYIKYNEAVRQRRKVLRKKDVPYLYAPMDLVPKSKGKITRKKHRGLPININMRHLDKAVWFKCPKEGFKDGDIIEVPNCLINEINNLSEPVYKQVKYPDGTSNTVLDYMDEKYSFQILVA